SPFTEDGSGFCVSGFPVFDSASKPPIVWSAVVGRSFFCMSILPRKCEPSAIATLGATMSPSTDPLSLMSTFSVAIRLPVTWPRTTTTLGGTCALIRAFEPTVSTWSLSWILPSTHPSTVRSSLALNSPLMTILFPIPERSSGIGRGSFCVCSNRADDVDESGGVGDERNGSGIEEAGGCTGSAGTLFGFGGSSRFHMGLASVRARSLSSSQTTTAVGTAQNEGVSIQRGRCEWHALVEGAGSPQRSSLGKADFRSA